MKKLYVLLVLGCSSLAFALDLNALQAELEALLPNDRAGAAIAYVSPEAETEIFVGNASFDENTLFEYGSITKVFTAVVLAQLAEEGIVELGASLNRYLPEAARGEKWQDVTLKQLATHTSGLPRVPYDLSLDLRFATADNPYAKYGEARLFRAVKNVVLLPPAAFNYYSNFGFGLLGTLLARQVGMPYEALLETRIFEPLGMSGATTHGWSSDNIAPPLLTRWGGGANYWDFDALAGAGAARGSLADALKFLKASMQACSQDGSLARANCKAQQPTSVKAGEYVTQGLGWIRSENPTGDIVWHNGGTGGFSTFLGFNVETGEGVVVLTNVADLDEVTSSSLESVSTLP